MEEPRRSPETGNPGTDLFEQARVSAAAALSRGVRVVWLTPPPGMAPERLLRASVADAGGCVVDGLARDLNDLASRILTDLGAPPFARPADVLRAFDTHLRSRGRRLAVGIRRPTALPARTLRELGALIRGRRDGLTLVLEGRGKDTQLWTALGVEPTVVRASGDSRPLAGCGAPRRGFHPPLFLAAGAGLATAAALTLIVLALRAPGPDPLAEAAPAPPAAVVPVEPEAAIPSSPIEAEVAPESADAVPRPTREPEDSEVLRSGRRALAALANARSDAEWEEGTRILREIGPQPALMQTLDELGARPGCVRKRGCVSTRDRLQAALCTAWADAVERGEAPEGLGCS